MINVTIRKILHFIKIVIFKLLIYIFNWNYLIETALLNENSPGLQSHFFNIPSTDSLESLLGL